MPEINIDPIELERVYRHNTNLATAKHFKISTSTLARLIIEAKIPPKGRGNKKVRIKIKAAE